MRDLSGVVAGYSTMKIVCTAATKMVGVDLALEDVDVGKSVHLSWGLFCFSEIGKTKAIQNWPAES